MFCGLHRSTDLICFMVLCLKAVEGICVCTVAACVMSTSNQTSFTLNETDLILGKHGGSVVSKLASQQNGLWFESRLSQDIFFLSVSVWSLQVVSIPVLMSSICFSFPQCPKTCMYSICELDMVNWP